MPGKAARPRKSHRIEHKPLRHAKRLWHYDGRLYPSDRALHITKIHGRLDDAAGLDAAIKAECKRLSVTVHLLDDKAGEMILSNVRLAMPWDADPDMAQQRRMNVVEREAGLPGGRRSRP